MQIINIVAIILSPIIAVVISECLRRRNFKKDKRLAILYNLMAFRDKVESHEFLSSLNSLKLFYKNQELNDMVLELRKYFQERDKGTINDQKSSVLIAKIIKKVCELEKFHHLTIEDIYNLFRQK